MNIELGKTVGVHFCRHSSGVLMYVCACEGCHQPVLPGRFYCNDHAELEATWQSGFGSRKPTGAPVQAARKAPKVGGTIARCTGDGNAISSTENRRENGPQGPTFRPRFEAVEKAK